MLIFMHRAALFIDHARLRVLLCLHTHFTARDSIDLAGRIAAGAAICDALIPMGIIILTHDDSITGQPCSTRDFEGKQTLQKFKRLLLLGRSSV